MQNARSRPRILGLATLMGVSTAMLAAPLGASATQSDAMALDGMDPALVACINEQLDQDATDPISEAQAGSITDLTCDGAGVASFDGIGRLPNLEQLSVDDNGQAIANLEALGALDHLETLSLFDARAGSLDFVSELTDTLTGLDVTLNSITDLSPLEDARSLRTLFAAYNSISDISPLAELPELVGVQIFGNYILDISSMAHFVPENNGHTRWIEAGSQSWGLDSVPTMTTQANPVIGFDGKPMPLVSDDAASFVLAPDDASWQFTNPGPRDLEWSWGPDDPEITFGGVLRAHASARSTTLRDDVLETPAGVEARVDPLSNDHAGDEPALDASTLTLLDAEESPKDTVTVEGGSFTVADGQVDFTPAQGFVGEVAPVSYQVANTDGRLGSAALTVTVTASEGTPEPPVVTDPADGSSSSGSGLPAAGGSKTGTLATTGSDLPVLALATGMSALLGGSALLWAFRRRRSQAAS